MDHNWYYTQLEEQEIRLTEGREVILSVLTDHLTDHPTVEEIYLKAHEINPSIGIATVYRTVDLLVNRGLAQKFEFGEGKARYELVPKPGDPGHHHHLVCKRCNKIINYDDFLEAEKAYLAIAEKGISERYNFCIDDHQIQFYGYCGDCAE